MSTPSFQQLLDQIRDDLSTLHGAHASTTPATPPQDYHNPSMTIPQFHQAALRVIAEAITKLEQLWEESQDLITKVSESTKKEVTGLNGELRHKETELYEIKQILGECRGELRWKEKVLKKMEGEVKGKEEELKDVKEMLEEYRGDLRSREKDIRSLREEILLMRGGVM